MLLPVKENKKALKSAKVLVLGLTYKKDVKDLREAPAIDIIYELIKKKIKVDYYDPIVPYLKIKGINKKAVVLNKKNISSYFIKVSFLRF